MSKKHRLFSEKEKLKKEYLQWCEKANKEIHGGRIDDKSFITVISFLQSIGWGNIKELESENAELRARMDKAVELKFKIGDTIYLIQRTAENPKGEVLETKFIDYEARNNSLIYIVIHGATYYQFNEDYIGKLVFTNKSEAESRLAELKGEK